MMAAKARGSRSHYESRDDSLCGPGIGAGLAGSFMATGDWQSAYVLGGAIFGLAFVLYYLYFARLDVPEAGLEPATARSRA
jgi:hypothetical protein